MSDWHDLEGWKEQVADLEQQVKEAGDTIEKLKADLDKQVNETIDMEDERDALALALKEAHWLLNGASLPQWSQSDKMRWLKRRDVFLDTHRALVAVKP